MNKTKRYNLSIVTIIFVVILMFLSVGTSIKKQTAYAAGSSISEATNINLGSSYSGTLSSNNKKDYYKFTLPESGCLNVNVTTTMGNVYYYIYDDTSTKVWGDYYSKGVDKDVEFAAGTYYFYVGYYNSYGSYSLSLTFEKAEESFKESQGGKNNDANASSGISLNQTYYGHLAINDKKDYYKFTLPSSGCLNVNVTTTMGNVYYYIYDSSVSKVWGDYYSKGVDKDVEFAAGTYYFYVGYYNSYGSYTFSLNFEKAEESFKESHGGNNNQAKDAMDIAINQTYYGHLAINDTKDYYKFILPESGCLNVNVTTTMGNVYYYIYDGSVSKVWGDYYSKGVDKNVEFAAGTYYFYVGYYNSYGSYTFSLNYEKTEESFKESHGGTNNQAKDASDISLNQTYNGHLAINDTKDYYKFTLTNSGSININVTTTMGNVYYYIYNSSVSKVWGDYYSKGVDKSVDLAAGTYYFYVGYYNSYGNYTFSLTEKHEHTGVWNVSTAPTCTGKGTEERICTICGKVETRDVDATGHINDQGKIIKETTIFQKGETEFTCTICGEKEITVDKSKVWVLPVICVGGVLLILGVINYIRMMKKKN